MGNRTPGFGEIEDDPIEREAWMEDFAAYIGQPKYE